MQPQDILPDHQNEVQVNGLTVRKGSVGAFLASVRDWQDAASNDATRACPRARRGTFASPVFGVDFCEAILIYCL